MKIRNEGKRTFFFNGGKLAPGEVVDIRNEAIAKALLSAYAKEIISLEDLKVRVVESSEEKSAFEEPAKAEAEEQPAVVDEKPVSKKAKKKSKKA